MRTIKRMLLMITVFLTAVSTKAAEVRIADEKTIDYFNNSQVISLSNDAQKLAFLGCIGMAKKKQEELSLELKKLEEQKFKQLIDDKSLDRESKEKLMERVIQCRAWKYNGVEARVRKAAEGISIAKSCAEQIFKRVQENTPDKKDSFREACGMIGAFADKQKNAEENSLIFYLPDTMECTSPVLVLAFIAKEIFRSNSIPAKVSISLVPGNSDPVIEVTVQKSSKKIILAKNFSLPATLEDVMINFLPLVTTKHSD